MKTDPSKEKLRETVVDQTKKPPASHDTRNTFHPLKLFTNNAWAARLWFFIALTAIAFAIIQPYLIISAYRTRERVVIMDSAGTFSISPLLSFQEAKTLHESIALWATLALFSRNPKGFDYPDMVQTMFLENAYKKAERDEKKFSAEFEAKDIHQKVEVFQTQILETREEQVLAKVDGQLLRTGLFERKAFVESLGFQVLFTLVRNPNMLANKRYPLAVLEFRYETSVE